MSRKMREALQVSMNRRVISTVSPNWNDFSDFVRDVFSVDMKMFEEIYAIAVSSGLAGEKDFEFINEIAPKLNEVMLFFMQHDKDEWWTSEVEEEFCKVYGGAVAKVLTNLRILSRRVTNEMKKENNRL